MPRRTRRGSFCAHRVGKRLWSWLDARPDRPGAGRQRGLGVVDEPAQRLGVERRAEEREVEGQLELVALPVEAGHAGRAGDVGLAEEQPGRVVGLGPPPPAPQDVVQLGSLGVHPLGLVVDPEVDRRVVAQLLVLDDHVADVDAEAGGAAVEPEAQDPVELLDEVRVPPVEVRLLGDEVVQVPLAGHLVEAPGRPAEGALPVVREGAVGVAGWVPVGPDVPVAVGGVAGGAGVEEPRVLVAGVVRHQVHEHADVPLGRGRDQLVEVGQRAERRVDVAVVGDVVAPVLVR